MAWRGAAFYALLNLKARAEKINSETPQSLVSRRLQETALDMATGILLRQGFEGQDRRCLKSGDAMGEFLTGNRSREPPVKHGFWLGYWLSAKSVALSSGG
jgi:hypothetical protein